MIQATTPTFILTLPETVDLTLAAKVVFTLTQGNTHIDKTGDALTVTAHSVSVYLDQRDTVRLFSGTASIQLNWTYADGSRAATNIATVNITPNLLTEVIT